MEHGDDTQTLTREAIVIAVSTILELGCFGGKYTTYTVHSIAGSIIVREAFPHAAVCSIDTHTHTLCRSCVDV